MHLRWLLPLTCLLGTVATHDALRDHRENPATFRWGKVSFLLFVGWFPLLVWIANVVWPQN